MGRERGLGRRAGEDFNVTCESGIGVERGENGGTEVAGGLEGGCQEFVDGGNQMSGFLPQ